MNGKVLSVWKRVLIWCWVLLEVLALGCASEKDRVQKVSPLGYSSGYPFHAGEFGGNLDLLTKLLTGPAGPQESNYFLDMWDNEELRSYARMHGLTNNHALFVVSHAETIQTKNGPRY